MRKKKEENEVVMSFESKLSKNKTLAWKNNSSWTQW